ncbi:thiol-disulfide oxidoreductase [Mergibacter septicus]|uniref:Thiol-disulfide oxidoreductase n=1 Tax=Mergibacter septicus TaxID=221402 RepID=A0A8E3MHE1_9PAST|nr:DsbE family thiol:disulfide interchange protein [Mergibacter septicus]AWX16009.1 thiol-disulfide oxidoreductase [Mergibacter septicus]QDJ15262.1 thiol-disulfide oxidoreductase [Mergibacter septicus]UTU47321.1 DsbE family thiol:disulfide interchange protein [Mergibacter septicus]WMR95502.1 DsbE family thiol:disulfide interchange protein [Mergibacter septicus]
MPKRLLLLLPLLLVSIIIGLLFSRLYQSSLYQETSQLRLSIPQFSLTKLEAPQQKLTNADLPQNQIYLLNIWGSWCGYCREEMPLLVKISQQYHLPIIGVNYLDQRQSALQSLKELGNPYQFNLFDNEGNLTSHLGLNGAPFTFLVDKKGIIRYYYPEGKLTETIWQKHFVPKLQQLLGE